MMTTNEIIEMAIKAELNLYVHDLTEKQYIQVIETFAKLVAEAAASKEREACAKVCEESQSPPDWNSVAILWKECKNKLAEAIRARGSNE